MGYIYISQSIKNNTELNSLYINRIRYIYIYVLYIYFIYNIEKY